MSASTFSLPHLLNLSLRLGGCGLNGDVIKAQGKSILHLHVCEADRDHKWIARGKFDHLKERYSVLVVEERGGLMQSMLSSKMQKGQF